MQFSTAVAVVALVAGVNAWDNGTQYTTEIVTAYTTYCPGATTIAHGNQTYTVTEATTLTITNCPCTITKPVYTSAVTACTTCTAAPVPVTTAPVYVNGTTVAPVAPVGTPAPGAPGAPTPAPSAPIWPRPIHISHLNRWCQPHHGCLRCRSCRSPRRRCLRLVSGDGSGVLVGAMSLRHGYTVIWRGVLFSRCDKYSPGER